MSVDLGNSSRGEIWINNRRNIFVGEIHRHPGALDHQLAVRDQLSELDLRSPAEALLPGAICHLEREAELMESRVHRLVQNRRGDLGVRKVRVDGEGELDQTRTLLVKIRASAREALNKDVGEVPLEMTEVVRDVLFDQRQRSLEARQNINGVDVGTRVVHGHGNPAHLVPRRCGVRRRA